MKAAGKLIDIISGHPFRGRVEAKPDGGVCVVQMKDVGENEAVRWRETVRTTLTGKKKPDYLQAGDVLLTARGSRNNAVCLEDVPCPAVCSPHFYLLRIKPGVPLLPAFLAWQLNQAPAQRYFEKSAEGSWQRSIRRPLLAALPLEVPEVALQEKVLAVAALVRREADTLRRLMENRERMLKSMAKDILGD